MSSVPIKGPLSRQIALQQRRLENHATQLAGLAPAAGRIPQPGGQHRQVRLAKTVSDTNDTPNYPTTAGGSFKIKFLDADYPRQVGTDTLENIAERGDPAADFDDFAFSTGGYWPPEGTELFVVRYVGKGLRAQRGEWYIMGGTSLPSWVGITGGIIAAGSSGPVTVWLDGVGTITTDVTATCHYPEEIGSGVKVDGTFINGQWIITGAECEQEPPLGITHPTPN